MNVLIKRTLVGAIVAFVWTNISWMGLTWHWSTIEGVPHEGPVAAALKSGLTETGVYLLPYSKDHSESGQKEVQERMKLGPYAFMIVHPNGTELSMGKMMGCGFFINLLVALMVSVMLNFTTLLSYLQKACFVSLVPAAGAFLVIATEINWWQFPWNYSLINFVDTIVTWFLAGLAIAKIK